MSMLLGNALSVDGFSHADLCVSTRFAYAPGEIFQGRLYKEKIIGEIIIYAPGEIFQGRLYKEKIIGESFIIAVKFKIFKVFMYFWASTLYN